MKQINQFLLTTLFLLLSCTSAFAFDCEVDGIYYNRLSTDELGVTSGTSKYTGDIVIPETVTYKDKVFKVTQITANAFKSCIITSVSIPQSVTTIGSSAFSGCSSLFSIVIPEGVNELGSSAFSGCTKATSVSLPNSITSIGSSAFENCSSITSITIHEGVMLLQDATFKGCSSLTSVVLPKSLTEIGNNVFQNCSALPSITLPQELKKISKYAFAGCGSLTSVDIQGKIETISDYAFQNCSSLKTFTMPVSVTSILKDAFSGCTGLQKVIVKDIASWCRINFTSSLSNPLYYAKHLYSDDETEITVLKIPYGVRRIGDYAFFNVEGFSKIYLTGIYNDAINIGNNTFSNSSYTWTDLYVPNRCIEYYKKNSNWNKFKSIIDYRIVLNNIEYSISGDNTVEVIKNNDYDYEGEVVIPSSIVFEGQEFIVTKIGDQAFQKCSGITGITIPNNVTNIGESVFEGCSGLTSITIPNHVTSIERYTFRNCSKLTSVTIPNSVTMIGNSAFECCSALNSISIPNSVTTIGNAAFLDCSGLSSISIPNSVKNIEIMAFANTSLTSVVIPNGVTSIGVNVFSGCSKLTSIKVESGNAVYDSRNNCNAIIITESNTLLLGCNSTVVPSSVTSIGQYGFSGCQGLTTFSIPNSVTSIGNGAFAYCFDLESVIIGSSVTSIGNWVFDDCQCLKSIYSMIENPFAVYELLPSQNKGVTLYVPTGTIDKYKSTVGWKDFKYIVEFDPAGITSVTLEKETPNAPIYDLNGRRLTVPQKGINIIGGKKVLIH